ncbi:SdiA-regulated domain-containing protein [Gynuella sunshinyii]|uniref:Phytase-like domain-containing protein n=1 Tax=Gynuella sunshinyii YC6258 TaxID=1445510 RepID=A0A0C5VJ95_9GAMM|nr:SdiA-regulated domain-containing protein [Gynuella sunshinyii]AJQ94336.1 hypothetical protein YC6258_02298 [Gynuella sunshinyii YC6258]
MTLTAILKSAVLSGMATMLSLAAPVWADTPPALQLLQAYVLDWPQRLDASGLSDCGGDLLAVADNIDGDIFKIDLSANAATIKPYLSLTVTDRPAVDFSIKHRLQHFADGLLNHHRFDWEGIDCTDQGYVLASESDARLYYFSTDGTQTGFTDVYPQAVNAGWFQVYNAFIEGIAYWQGTFYGAAERNPRGMFTVNGDSDTVVFTDLPNDDGLTFVRNSLDIADLAIFDGYLYTLERNASAICKRTLQGFTSLSCYSYAAHEWSDRYGYRDTEYGIGEGLAVTANRIYVLLDNNGKGRIADPDDTRTMLLEFNKPENF